VLIRRLCPRGRSCAALLVLLATSRPLSAAPIGSDAWVDEQRSQLATRAGGPEAIATVAALADATDSMRPGRYAELLREILVGKSPDPLVAAQVAYLLSLEDDRNGHHDPADRARQGLGFLRDAWVVGPFDSQGRTGLGQVYPVEEDGARVDPRADRVFRGKERDVRWRRAPGEAFVQGALLLDALLRPDSDAVAYCFTYVHSDRDRWAALRLGSGGPLKAWLNGEQAVVRDVVRPAWPDQDAVPVYLRRGTNVLLVKTVAVRGPWRLFVRLTDGRGDALAGVRLSADSPGPGPRRPGSHGRAPAIRELGKLLRNRALAAPAELAAQAWLDAARFLSLVTPADVELRLIEETAKAALPKAGATLDPAAIEALLLLGSVAREDDDRRAALERALPALTSAAERADLLASIGRLWRSQHRDAAAVAAWHEALALAPHCVLAQLALGREERRTGMPASALVRLQALPETVRAWPAVEDALAETLSALGRRREAESLRRRMLTAQQTDVALLRDLASAARTRGDAADAATYYAEAVRWRPDFTSLIVDQAAMLEAAGDIAGARAVLAKAAERLPDDAGLPEELGRLEARAGQVPAALAGMQRSLDLRPQNPGLRRYLQELAATRKAGGRAGSADDLARAHAADGEALAREALFGKPAADEASAEVLLDRTVVRVHANGLAERFVQRLIHLRTERAARESRESSVRFEPGRQEVEIRKARIVRRAADGNLEISEATGRDEENLSEPWYGLYYDTRAAIVSFENVRAGDVVELQYTVVDVGHRNELHDYFGDLVMIADAWPTRRWDYTLIAPAGRTFYFNQPRWPGVGPTRHEQGGEARYEFAAHDVPRVESEPSMPGRAEVAPYLHVSTYRSWQDVGRWYWNLVSDQMQDDGSLRKAAVAAVNGATSVADKVRAIHRFVLDNTRYVGLEFGIHGYKPYKATQVLERRFGDCKDKATLFVTLLRAVGVDSELVLLRTRRGGRIDETPASLAAFDHAIAYVPALDLYVDGTAEFSGLGELPAQDQDTMALRVSARDVKLVRMPVLPAERNLAQRQWQVDLRADGSGRIVEDLTVVGQAASEWRSYYQTEGERTSRFAKVWNGRFAGTQLESVRMELADRNQPVRVHAEVLVPQLGDRREGGEVRLPLGSREADLASTYARMGERHWPLVLGYPWHHDETVTYHFPAGARLVRAPSARRLTTPFGEFSLATEPTADGIVVRSTLKVTTSRIETQQYAAFRAFLRNTDAALEERVVVTLGGAP
jgi:cellulose synthase operon protein C